MGHKAALPDSSQMQLTWGEVHAVFLLPGLQCSTCHAGRQGGCSTPHTYCMNPTYPTCWSPTLGDLVKLVLLPPLVCSKMWVVSGGASCSVATILPAWGTETGDATPWDA